MKNRIAAAFGFGKKNEAQAAAVSAPPVKVTLPEVSGFTLKYNYDDVDVMGSANYDTSAARVGILVDLVEEPNNPHDPKAVAVKLKGATLGYIPANNIQSMVHDYRARGGAVLGKVSFIGAGKLQIAIGFYDEAKAKKASANDDYKCFNLTGNSNTEMQENISVVSVGDNVSVEYDPDKEKYLAVCGGEIGYFPKGAETLIEGNPRVLVEEVDEKDNGKYAVSVAVFLS